MTVNNNIVNLDFVTQKLCNSLAYIVIKNINIQDNRDFDKYNIIEEDYKQNIHLYEELEDKFKKIINNNYFYNELNDLFKNKMDIDNLINNYYIKELSIVNQKYEKEQLINFKDKIFKVFHNDAPYTVIVKLKVVIENITSKINHHNRVKIFYENQRNSALTSFYNLSKVSSIFNINAAWKALTLSCQAKIRIEKEKSIIESYNKLIHLCRDYVSYATSSYNLLNKLEKSLEKKVLNNIILMTIINTQTIDIKKQQSSLEIWIGHSLNYWGNSPVSKMQIENKLVSNLLPLAESILIDFKHLLLDYS